MEVEEDNYIFLMRKWGFFFKVYGEIFGLYDFVVIIMEVRMFLGTRNLFLVVKFCINLWINFFFGWF